MVKKSKRYGVTTDDIMDYLKGDLVVLMKTEDQKVLALIQLLVQKKVITDGEAKKVVKIDPFRQSHIYAGAN